MTTQTHHSADISHGLTAVQPWSFRLTRMMLVLLAIGLVTWGGVVAAQLLLTPTLTIGLGETVQAGDLAFSVDALEWLSMNHAHDEESSDVSLRSDDADEAAAAAAALGFSMPPSMMPGLPPEGYQRLRVELTLQNIGAGREEIGPAHFRVESADGAVYLPLQNSAFRAQELVAGQGIGAVLFIDVPEDAKASRLIWARGGKRVVVPMNNVEAHGHIDE
jgi:hypothetical protein